MMSNAYVICGSPRCSAISGPTCAVSPSTACLPQRIKSNFNPSFSSTALIASEQAKEAIKTCLSVGADAGYLISSRKFGGSDTLATSYILSVAIKAVEEKEGLKSS